MNQTKVLITGGAGFLAAHTIPLLLNKNYHIVLMDNFATSNLDRIEKYSSNDSVEFVHGDITDINDVRHAMDGCSLVYHLAVLDVRQSLKEPQRVSEVIIKGTMNCLDVAVENKIELFVNCSSTEVYGSAVSIPMDESHPMFPTNPYAAAKIAQDMYVYSYGELYGLPWTTLRPCNMYGEDSYWQGFRAELIPRMIIRAMNNKPLVIFGTGNQTRDFAYVKDSARALVSLAESPNAVGMIVNCCTGRETSVREVAELICALFDLNPQRFIVTYDPRPGDVMRHQLDNSLLKDLIEYVPNTPLETGVPLTIEWLKSLPYTPKELFSKEELRCWN